MQAIVKHFPFCLVFFFSRQLSLDYSRSRSFRAITVNLLALGASLFLTIAQLESRLHVVFHSLPQNHRRQIQRATHTTFTKP